jgi:hypothetical protein
MSCPPYTKFQKVTEVGNSLLNSELESNLKWYIDWGMLGIGGWTDVTIPTSGAWGGTFDRLRPVQDPAYTDGQVWESSRKDWVWETGTPYSGYNPIQVSGVYVDSSYKTTGEGAFSHHYDYPNGRVVFDSAISTSSTVQAEYSYRNVQAYIADQAPWWDELQYDSLRVDDPSYLLSGSGSWGILANHRVQMPAIVVETVSRRRMQPYQMGNTSQIIKQDMLFHVLAEDRWWRNQIIDILTLQKDSTIWLYNSNTLADSGVFPLDYRGMKTTSPLNYDYIVETEQYRYKKARFTDISVTEMQSLTQRLHQGTVRVSFEVFMG